ncbi:MAG TPA: RDD family protein [Salinibacter sp.]|nr:RDD family protein [Salinibacter sp.]
MSPSSPSSAGTAPEKLTRFLALLIDSIVAGVLSSIPMIGGLLGAGYFVVRDGLELEFMHERSLGKHLMDLHVHRLDGRPMDIETSVRRNWMWGLGPVASAVAAFPLFGGFFSAAVGVLGLAVGLYEAYRVLTRDDGRRWGDELADTQVTG